MLAASYEAKAFGVAHGNGRKDGARSSAQHAIVVPPRMSAYVDASKAVFAVFEELPPSSRGSRSTRRSSTPAGSGTSAARPRDGAPAAAGRARSGRAADHRRRCADEVPGEGRERRREADGLLVVAAEPRARVPPPAAGRAALGRRRGDGREAPLVRPRHRRRGRRALREVARRAARPVRRDASCTRSRTIAIPDAWRAARAAARSARSGRSGWRSHTPEEVDAALLGARRPRHPPHAEGATHRPHRRAAPAIHRLPRGYALAHACVRDLPHADHPRDRARPARRRRPGDRAARADARRHRGEQPRGRHPTRQLVLALEQGEALDAALDEIRERFGVDALTWATPLGRSRGFTVPLLPTDAEGEGEERGVGSLLSGRSLRAASSGSSPGP